MLLVQFIVLSFLVILITASVKWKQNTQILQMTSNLSVKKASILLLLINCLLIGIVFILLFVSTIIPIPIIALVGLVPSLLFWCDLGNKLSELIKDRLKVVFFGNLIYLLLLVFSLFKLKTITPQYPGEDIFMESLGYFIFSVICIGAIVVSSFVLLYRRK